MNFSNHSFHWPNGIRVGGPCKDNLLAWNVMNKVEEQTGGVWAIPNKIANGAQKYTLATTMQGVVCVGDSLTAGSNVAENDRYPEKLGLITSLNLNVSNLGIGGATISEMEATAAYDSLLGEDSNVMILWAGVNDWSQEPTITKEELLTRIIGYVNRLTSLGWKVIVITHTPANRTDHNGVSWFQAIEYMSQKIVEYWPYNSVDLRNTPLYGDGANLNPVYYDDGTHHTAVGKAIIAEEVNKVLLRFFTNDRSDLNNYVEIINSPYCQFSGVELITLENPVNFSEMEGIEIKTSFLSSRNDIAPLMRAVNGSGDELEISYNNLNNGIANTVNAVNVILKKAGVTQFHAFMQLSQFSPNDEYIQSIEISHNGLNPTFKLNRFDLAYTGYVNSTDISAWVTPSFIGMSLTMRTAGDDRNFNKFAGLKIINTDKSVELELFGAEGKGNVLYEKNNNNATVFNMSAGFRSLDQTGTVNPVNAINGCHKILPIQGDISDLTTPDFEISSGVANYDTIKTIITNIGGYANVRKTFQVAVGVELTVYFRGIPQSVGYLVRGGNTGGIASYFNYSSGVDSGVTSRTFTTTEETLIVSFWVSSASVGDSAAFSNFSISSANDGVLIPKETDVSNLNTEEIAPFEWSKLPYSFRYPVTMTTWNKLDTLVWGSNFAGTPDADKFTWSYAELLNIPQTLEDTYQTWLFVKTAITGPLSALLTTTGQSGDCLAKTSKYVKNVVMRYENYTPIRDENNNVMTY